jgi:hypothetical protein
MSFGDSVKAFFSNFWGTSPEEGGEIQGTADGSIGSGAIGYKEVIEAPGIGRVERTFTADQSSVGVNTNGSASRDRPSSGGGGGPTP